MQHSGDGVIDFDLILRQLRHHVINSNHALKRSKMQKESQMCVNRKCTGTCMYAYNHVVQVVVRMAVTVCQREISKTNLDF